MGPVLSNTQIVLLSVLFTSLVYLISIIIIFLTKKNIDNNDTKIYRKLLFINFISIFLELTLYFLGIIVNNQSGFLMDIFLLMSKVFTCFICLWFYEMCKYTKSIYDRKNLNNNEKNNKKIKMDYSFAFFCIIIILVPTKFIVENNTGYTNGPSTKFAGLLMIMYCLEMVYYLFKLRKSLKSKEFVPIILSVVSLFITIIVQTVNPALLLSNPMITLVTIIMYHTIENPDVKMLEETEKAKMQAEKANRAKSDFLGSLSSSVGESKTMSNESR